MKIIKVTGAIIQNGNNFLICRRGPNEKSAGLWEFPGGKIEADETPKDCIKRELKEELNIDAEIGEMFSNYTYNYPHVSYKLYFFKIKKFDGNLKKTVHDKIRWETLINFSNYNFLEGDKPVIKKLLREN